MADRQVPAVDALSCCGGCHRPSYVQDRSTAVLANDLAVVRGKSGGGTQGLGHGLLRGKPAGQRMRRQRQFLLGEHPGHEPWGAQHDRFEASDVHDVYSDPDDHRARLGRMDVPTLRGERVLLRAPNPVDVTELVDIRMTPEVQRWWDPPDRDWALASEGELGWVGELDGLI